MSELMKEILQAGALQKMMKAELMRSESFEDFMTWLQSSDRKAEDIRNLINNNGMRPEASEIIRKFREWYEGNPERFNLDKRTCPV
jgi:hypothetical protein